MESNKPKKFLVIKLGKTSKKIDFLDEHQKIINKNGFVDFARFGSKGISLKDYSKECIFIKESKENGDRLVKAIVEEVRSNGEKYPPYYADLLIYGTIWFRIKKMELVDKVEFLKTHTLVNGNDIKGLSSGTASFFYVVDRG